MHNPGVILSKAIQRTSYNAGRVMKEAGLSKSLLLLLYHTHIYIFNYSYGSIWFKTFPRYWLRTRFVKTQTGVATL